MIDAQVGIDVQTTWFKDVYCAALPPQGCTLSVQRHAVGSLDRPSFALVTPPRYCAEALQNYCLAIVGHDQSQVFEYSGPPGAKKRTGFQA